MGKRHILFFLQSLRAKAGQAMVEYVLATGVLLAFSTVMAFFLYALRLRADRVLSLVGLDHP